MDSKAYGYARLFPGEPEQALQGQALDISRAYQHEVLGGYDWADLLVDREPPCARGRPAFSRLEDRPEGFRLAGLLRPGDVVVMAALERGFDRVRDFVATANGWIFERIGLVVAQFEPARALDTRTRAGQAAVYVAGRFREFEQAVRRRAREGLQAAGLVPGGQMYGARWSRRKGKAVPWPEQRAVGALIVELFDGRGMTVTATWEELSRRGVVHPRTGRPLGRKTVHDWLIWEREAQARERVGGAG